MASDLPLLPGRYGLFTISFLNKNEISEEEIKQDFQKFGEVVSVSKYLGVSGIERVFVKYRAREEAEAALATSRGKYGYITPGIERDAGTPQGRQYDYENHSPREQRSHSAGNNIDAGQSKRGKQVSYSSCSISYSISVQCEYVKDVAMDSVDVDVAYLDFDFESGERHNEYEGDLYKGPREMIQKINEGDEANSSLLAIKHYESEEEEEEHYKEVTSQKIPHTDTSSHFIDSNRPLATHNLREVGNMLYKTCEELDDRSLIDFSHRHCAEEPNPDAKLKPKTKDMVAQNDTRPTLSSKLAMFVPCKDTGEEAADEAPQPSGANLLCPEVQSKSSLLSRICNSIPSLSSLKLVEDAPTSPTNSAVVPTGLRKHNAAASYLEELTALNLSFNPPALPQLVDVEGPAEDDSAAEDVFSVAYLSKLAAKQGKPEPSASRSPRALDGSTGGVDVVDPSWTADMESFVWVRVVGQDVRRTTLSSVVTAINNEAPTGPAERAELFPLPHPLSPKAEEEHVRPATETNQQVACDRCNGTVPPHVDTDAAEDCCGGTAGSTRDENNNSEADLKKQSTAALFQPATNSADCKVRDNRLQAWYCAQSAPAGMQRLSSCRLSEDKTQPSTAAGWGQTKEIEGLLLKKRRTDTIQSRQKAAEEAERLKQLAAQKAVRGRAERREMAAERLKKQELAAQLEQFVGRGRTHFCPDEGLFEEEQQQQQQKILSELNTFLRQSLNSPSCAAKPVPTVAIAPKPLPALFQDPRPWAKKEPLLPLPPQFRQCHGPGTSPHQQSTPAPASHGPSPALPNYGDTMKSGASKDFYRLLDNEGEDKATDGAAPDYGDDCWELEASAGGSNTDNSPSKIFDESRRSNAQVHFSLDESTSEHCSAQPKSYMRSTEHRNSNELSPQSCAGRDRAYNQRMAHSRSQGPGNVEEIMPAGGRGFSHTNGTGMKRSAGEDSASVGDPGPVRNFVSGGASGLPGGPPPLAGEPRMSVRSLDLPDVMREVFVANLPPHVTAACVGEMFSWLGPCRVSPVRVTGMRLQLPYCVVRFATVQQAESALGLDDRVVDGFPLLVRRVSTLLEKAQFL